MLIWADSLESLKYLWPSYLFDCLPHVSPGPWPQEMVGISPLIQARSFPEQVDYWDHLLVMEKTTASQYDLLRKAESPQLPLRENLACVVLVGHHCHGQHDRPWVTLQGNLHLTLQAQVRLDARQCSRALVMLPALAVLDYLDQLCPRPADLGIKWINDILLQDKKIAGVLTSARSEKGQITSVTFGIGLNVTGKPDLPVTSLMTEAVAMISLLGQETPSLGSVLLGIMKAVAGRLDQLNRQGSRNIYEGYKARSLVMGRQVAVWPSASGSAEGQADTEARPQRQGTVLDILPDLSLILSDDNLPVTEGRLYLT